MKKIITLSLVLLTSLILSGCGSSNQTPTNTNNSTPTTGPSISSNSVNIKNFAFDPSTLTIKKGTTVTWTNNDSAPHGIKSTSFNSDQLTTGQSFSFTFTDSGTFDYSCSIHPSMTGKIIVE